MLGKSIRDPKKIESIQESIDGLGLLNSTTIFHNDKTTMQVKARIAVDKGLLKGLRDIEITGYEIHMGQTISQDCLPVLHISETPQGKVNYSDGAVDSTGLIFGTYVHGLFHNAKFTHSFLNRLRQLHDLPSTPASTINRQEIYDKLAYIIRHNIDMSQVYKIALGGHHG